MTRDHVSVLVLTTACNKSIDVILSSMYHILIYVRAVSAAGKK